MKRTQRCGWRFHDHRRCYAFAVDIGMCARHAPMLIEKLHGRALVANSTFVRLPPQPVPFLRDVWLDPRSPYTYDPAGIIARGERLPGDMPRSTDEERLCFAMLEQAIHDLNGTYWGTANEIRSRQLMAALWITGPWVDDAPGLTFDDVCDTLRVNPDSAREHLAPTLQPILGEPT